MFADRTATMLSAMQYGKQLYNIVLLGAPNRTGLDLDETISYDLSSVPQYFHNTLIHTEKIEFASE